MTGQWILENNLRKWYNNSDVSLEDDPDQDWDYEGGYYGPRETIKRDEATKLYTAMGLTAQRMPKLRYLEFIFRSEVGERGPSESVMFEKNVRMEKVDFGIYSSSGFGPGVEVLDAWRVREAGEGKVEEMTRRLGRVGFEKWPPA
jgi:hypothetical protein